MLIKDLDELKVDTKQNGLYNLFALTYNEVTDVKIQTYIVQPEDEMRMDLVSFNIYESIDHVDFLCNFNSIDNPLNVKQGDIINYVSIDTIDAFIASEPNDDEIRQGLLNANKAKRKDSKRQEFVENDFTLPPTFSDIPQPGVQIVGNSLLIG